MSRALRIYAELGLSPSLCLVTKPFHADAGPNVAVQGNLFGRDNVLRKFKMD